MDALLARLRELARPGDHVVFPRSAGVWVEVEDERLLVCRVTELLVTLLGPHQLWVLARVDIVSVHTPATPATPTPTSTPHEL